MSSRRPRRPTFLAPPALLAGFALIAGSGAAATSAAGQEPLTEHTLRAAEGATGAAATVADLAWLAGHWQGLGLGGLVEEVWTPPLADGMMGMFRLVHGDSVAFYEIFTLTAPEGRPEIRLKHFDPDLSGWEERVDVVRFPLLRLGRDEASFEGLTMRRVGRDELRVFLAIQREDGSVREESFTYYRVGSEAHREHVAEPRRPRAPGEGTYR